MAMFSGRTHWPRSIERKKLAFSVGVDPDRLAFARQTHSDNIQFVVSPGLAGNCDSLITNRLGLTLSIMVADCVPIFLYASDSETIGLVHAGWKGTAEGVVEKTVKEMVRRFGSHTELIEVFIGPSIKPCCYEIQKDVANVFSERFLEMEETNRTYLNLQEAIRHQLRSCLIKEKNIQADDRCTYCHREHFHSYRREGDKASRMLCVMTLT